MTTQEKDLFNNIGKPQFTALNSIYDLTKNDIKELRARDEEMLKQYHNWENHEDRQLLIAIINEWCEAYRCYTLHY